MRRRGKNGGGTGRTLRRVAGVLLAAAVLLALPASAPALSLSNLTAQPTGTDATQAGGHKDFHIHMDFSGGQVKDLTVGLPPGMVGDPNATPQCTDAQLNSATAGNDGCPANTQVGSVVANATVTVVLPVTLDVSGKLYNLVPHPGEPARFGIVLQPGNLLGAVTLPLDPIVLQSAVQLRPDYGLDTIINDIPNSTAGFATTINSQDITLNGVAPVTGKPFMRNPTSCPGPHTTSFTAVPYSGSTATGTASFSTDGCDALDFSPAFSAIVGGAVGSQKTDVTTSIDQDLDEAGLIKATVTIPPDLNPDANLLGNRCSPTEFLASNCPPSSVMGSAIAASPLLTQPLAGNVVFVDTGGVPDIGLDLQGQLHLLLRGSLGLDKVVTFDGLPDIPIAHFALTFPSSPGLLSASRNLCEPPPPLFHADFVGYNGATTSVDSPGTIVGSCNPTANAAKCKKAKKKKRKHRAAEAKKKHKKSCKKKKRKKRR
jgi:hypothetical protein